MNRKVMILVIFVILIVLIFSLIHRNIENKRKENEDISKTEMELKETTFKDSFGEKYMIKYNEASLVYEIYDDNGYLLVTCPTESGVKDYIENPELIRVVN